MEHSNWVYRNKECNVMIGKVPIYFERVAEEGNKDTGSASFRSTSKYDDAWGSDAKLDLSWEPADPMSYHHGRKVRESIKMYGALNISVLKKETDWVRTHECTFWWGSRKQILQKRFFASHEIHSVLFCEQTNRVFQFHGTIVNTLVSNYEELILETMKSLICHDM